MCSDVFHAKLALYRHDVVAQESSGTSNCQQVVIEKVRMVHHRLIGHGHPRLILDWARRVDNHNSDSDWVYLSKSEVKVQV